MDINNLEQIKTAILARIEAIADAEVMGYEQLKPLSRELLEYVPLTGDIDIVNRLLSVLKPVMRTAAVNFFGNFLPWNYNSEIAGFDDKIKSQKRLDKKKLVTEQFLSEADSSIYSWKKENTPPKEIDYVASITKAVKNGMDDSKGKLDVNETLAGVMGGGISLEDLATFLAAAAAELVAAEAA